MKKLSSILPQTSTFLFSLLTVLNASNLDEFGLPKWYGYYVEPECSTATVEEASFTSMDEIVLTQTRSKLCDDCRLIMTLEVTSENEPLSLTDDVTAFVNRFDEYYAMLLWTYTECATYEDSDDDEGPFEYKYYFLDDENYNTMCSGAGLNCRANEGDATTTNMNRNYSGTWQMALTAGYEDDEEGPYDEGSLRDLTSDGRFDGGYDISVEYFHSDTTEVRICVAVVDVSDPLTEIQNCQNRNYNDSSNSSNENSNVVWIIVSVIVVVLIVSMVIFYRYYRRRAAQMNAASAAIPVYDEGNAPANVGSLNHIDGVMDTTGQQTFVASTVPIMTYAAGPHGNNATNEGASAGPIPMVTYARGEPDEMEGFPQQPQQYGYSHAMVTGEPPQSTDGTDTAAVSSTSEQPPPYSSVSGF